MNLAERKSSGAHPETKAFYDTYHGDLQDDNNEFAHMQSGDVVMGSNDEDGDPEAEEIKETVSTWDVRDQLRAAAQRDEVSTLKVPSYICC